ncbi:hypothetical protein ASPCADRAFT_210308 [Aspergillus carbonarius ITEM 5010]|uniref:Uncharacterized protein n=1 Tax=Aspergillus carbonarius (strain ITEM 5010) TaxID=602072 RepID=A0A1R3RDA2_ASPC5|nr:hypothetical protein ASPCADRAFT_210308 [Aspergillus carbonarius ITEM 5010]
MIAITHAGGLELLPANAPDNSLIPFGGKSTGHVEGIKDPSLPMQGYGIMSHPSAMGSSEGHQSFHDSKHTWHPLVQSSRGAYHTHGCLRRGNGTITTPFWKPPLRKGSQPPCACRKSIVPARSYQWRPAELQWASGIDGA